MQKFEKAGYKYMLLMGNNNEAFFFCKSLCLLLSHFGSLADYKTCFLSL